MAANTFGEVLRLTSFGESHGKAIGGVLDGFPAGIPIDYELINKDMQRRRPGQSHLASPRAEADEVEFLSGIYEGITTGSPIAFVIWNKDKKSADYDHLKHAFRPSHADFTYQAKYGFRDHRGGGRSSARETAARVVAGALAKILCAQQAIRIVGFVSGIGTVEMPAIGQMPGVSEVEQSLVRCPHMETANAMQELIEQTMAEGDTLGGVVSCIIDGLPPGLGEPVFDKLHADLGKAMLSINAVKGFEYGSGFAGTAMKGSSHNDIFVREGDNIHTLTNHSGGIQGGISNGEQVYFRVAFKPVATLMRDQQTVDKDGNTVTIAGKGRHDVCVVPRAVPIVEAMAALVIGDHLLRQRINTHR
jgi:chorismate synthase